MRARFQALLIGLVLSSAAAIAFVVWGPETNGWANAPPLPSPAQSARLTTIAAKEAVSSPYPLRGARVISTTDTALFRFNHGYGSDTGARIYLLVLYGASPPLYGRSGPSRSYSRFDNLVLGAPGEDTVFEFRPRDLSQMGFGVNVSATRLTRLGPSIGLQLP